VVVSPGLFRPDGVAVKPVIVGELLADVVSTSRWAIVE
jgi:hypothetical protein